MSRTIRPEKILRELDELWVALATQEEQGSTGVLRACAMTLIVLTGESVEQEGLGETLAALMRDHPSRLIVVRTTGGDTRELEASVTAQCWKPFGQHQQICCELITFRATSRGAEDLAPVLRALVAADLPVVVWVHGQNLIHASEFAALFRLAGKLIVDSTNAARPEDMLVRIRALTGARRGVADLSWTRLTRWREVIAQFLGAPEFRERLPAIDAVAISYCGDKPPTRTLYLSAWLRRSIGDHVRIRFESGRPDHPEGIHRVAFTGADAEINMQLAGHFIEVRTGNHEARHHFPPLRDYDLLREELSLAGHDPTFEAVLTALCEGGLNRVFQRT